MIISHLVMLLHPFHSHRTRFSAFADKCGTSSFINDFVSCVLQELESTVEGWTDDITSLFMLRDSLDSVVSGDDITVLQERLQLLQRQWEEICHQVRARCTHHIFILSYFNAVWGN